MYAFIRNRMHLQCGEDMHMPCLYRSFFAKEPYDWWLFCIHILEFKVCAACDVRRDPVYLLHHARRHIRVKRLCGVFT